MLAVVENQENVAALKVIAKGLDDVPSRLLTDPQGSHHSLGKYARVGHRRKLDKPGAIAETF